MKNRKFLSLLLALSMILALVPSLAAAEPTGVDEAIIAEQIEAPAQEQIETEEIAQPEMIAAEPVYDETLEAAEADIELAEESASPVPTRDPNEKFYLINANYREHPSTSSIFDEGVPNKLFWVEFSSRVDHEEDYDEASKTYSIDGNYYQLVIERPQHGPNDESSGATPHPAASMVPDNGVAGFVRDDLTDRENVHRYHGWEVGSESLFHKDETPEYQVGEYTAKLYRVTPTEGTPAPELVNCESTFVNSKTINIVEVKYTLSQEDRQKNYKLKCPIEPSPSTEITELATVGDWVTMIDPSLDYSEVQDLNGQTRTIVGWKLVKDGGDEKVAIGDAIPSDSETAQLYDGKADNKITLEAVIGEPKIYSYEFQKNDDSGTPAFPTAPPATSAEPNPTAPPASYNELASASAEPEKIEYEPAATVKPLELRLVNTGNQRVYVHAWNQDPNFTVEKINMNPDAKELVTSNVIFDIPSKTEAQEKQWKDYALVRITPRKGLGAGTYTTQISAMRHSGGSRFEDKYNLTVTIDKKEVKVVPQSKEKEYGQTLTPADILCDVYDSQDNDIGTDLTAAELGITLKCDGMGQDAKVNNGELYKFESIEDTDLDGDNFTVELKEGTETGVTVKKTTPTINVPVTASGMTNGRQLSSSKLSGGFVNKNSHQTVQGTLAWVEPEKEIRLAGPGTTTESYKFTPEDQENYNEVEGKASIVVSEKRATNITMSSTEKTYNGKPQSPGFKWDRGSTPVVGTNIQVVYKLVTDGNTDFAEDEDFSEKGGYTSDLPVNAGTYKVHVTSTENNIFAAGLLNAIMTINPYTLDSKKLSTINSTHKIYDGTKDAIADTSKIKYTKAKTDDDVSIVQGALRGTYDSAYADMNYLKTVTLDVLTKEQFEAANPGVEVPDTYPLTGADAANYTLAKETLHSTGWIRRRPLTIKLKDDIHKYYGDTHAFSASECEPAAAQASNGGLAPGETIENVNFELYTDQNAEASEAKVGSYDVKVRIPSGVSEYNYDIDTTNPVGSIIIEKTTPKALSVNSDNGSVGRTLQSLVDEHFKGTFENPYSHEILQGGKLEWVNPQERLTKEKSKYQWKYTPEDQTNYNVLTGEVEITVSDKPIAQILEFNVPEEVTYNGEAHPITLRTNVAGARTTVEYRKLDIELHDDQPQDEVWDMTPPVNAGTYQVRGTIYATEEYAENSITETMTILQAEPKGTVTASNVNKGDVLSSSQLDYSFTGVKDEKLEGTAAWQEVGVTKPSEIVVDAEASYDWIFAPESTNYKTVTGKATVGVNINTRAPEATVYNIPSTTVGGDYAYVKVDGINLMVGDVVTFYHDAQMLNPLNSGFTIAEGMDGLVKIVLDNELNQSGGTIYVNIKNSETVKPIEYKPQVGFTLSKTQVYIKSNESDTVTIEPSDPSYVLSSAEWISANTAAATVATTGNGQTATISGVDDGTARIDVTALFDHPDESVSDKISVSASALVTVTEEEPPKYKYTTKDATDITYTGATLNGHIDITLPEGSSITPVASCKFELWEDGSSEKTVYDANEILRESGDYSIPVGGLKPDTTYCYRAFGAQSDTEAETKTFTTGSAPVPTATPEPSASANPGPSESTAPSAMPEPSAAPNVIPVTDVQPGGNATEETVDLTAGTGYNDEVKAVFGDNFAEIADNKITGIDNESVVTAPVTIKEKGDYEFEVLAVDDKDNNVLTLTPVLAEEGFTDQHLEAEGTVGKAGSDDVYLYTYIARDLDPGDYTVTYKSATQAEASDFIAMAIVKLTEEPAPTPGTSTEPTATPEPSESTAPTATPEPSESTAPSATPEPSESTAPSATPGTTTEPTATPGTTAEPTATPGTTTEPTATPGTTTEPTATPGTTTEPTATPGTTAEPTATPGTTTGPTATPGTTTGPTATPGTTTEPEQSSEPLETLVPTLEPGAPVRYAEKPVLNKENISASVVNNSGGEVWFIAAAYRDEVLIDFKVVTVPVGTNPVTAKFDADYSADSSVDVMFYLWDAKTLKPYADPIPGK